ncbi:MAG: alginate export family protein [Bacteroidota bacterium]
MKSYRVLTILLLHFFHSVSPLFAQQQDAFKSERAQEDYTHLKDSTNLGWQQAVKYISLSGDRSSYLSIGGSFRPRYEHFSNRFWIKDNDENYYSQRLSFHTDWHLGQFVRLFGELYHGYKTDGMAFPQSDDLDVHQLFVAFELPIEQTNISFRFGRQEMKLGSGRLIDLRVGPNMRRSFDLARIIFQKDQLKFQAFYGKEVQSNFGAFDNAVSFFDEEAVNPRTWGVYSQFPINPGEGKNYFCELYYLGFQSDFASFSDVSGAERRHSIGLRSFGSIGRRFQYNSELIYQFGDLDGRNISAFNFETDWKFAFIDKKWRPTLGLKLDLSSGDRQAGDNKLNSFNPMFVNPAIYSLAAINTPINLFSLHPALILFPYKKLMINLEFAAFYRTASSDGLYAPPSIQSRRANGLSQKHIGNTVGLYVQYTHNRHLSFDIRSSLFIAGAFVEETGVSESILQFTPTLNLYF